MIGPITYNENALTLSKDLAVVSVITNIAYFQEKIFPCNTVGLRGNLDNFSLFFMTRLEMTRQLGLRFITVKTKVLLVPFPLTTHITCLHDCHATALITHFIRWVTWW